LNPPFCGSVLVAALAAATLALASAALGCGGSTEADVPPLSRAQFLKTADAICEKSDSEQESALIAFQKKNPKVGASSSAQEKIVRAVGLPPVELEIEKIAALPPPEGDEEKIEEIVGELEDAFAKSQEDPSPLLKGAGAFAGVEKLIRAYGFKGGKSCANPL